jgi:hypothetical protein
LFKTQSQSLLWVTSALPINQLKRSGEFSSTAPPQTDYSHTSLSSSSRRFGPHSSIPSRGRRAISGPGRSGLCFIAVPSLVPRQRVLLRTAAASPAGTSSSNRLRELEEHSLYINLFSRPQWQECLQSPTPFRAWKSSDLDLISEHVCVRG